MKYLLLIASLCLFSHSVISHNHGGKTMAETIVVERAWARETFKMAKAGAAYITLNNPSDSDITLVSASVDASVASMVEIHETKMANGMMQMQELENGALIAANQTLVFEPGGMHFMLMGLAEPLEAGKQLKLTMTFSDESEKTVDMLIQDMRNRSAAN
jgi:copper(I)-binding protein